MSDLKYKVGDKVKVFKGKGTGFAGCIGTVLEINPELLYEYTILIDSKKRCFKESELELVQEGGKTIHDKLLQGISKISIGDQPFL